MRRHRNRNGYVLLMTVMLIAISGLMLAGMVRQGLLLTLEARDVQEDLQRRWGALSCQRAILSQAESVLGHQDSQDSEDGIASSQGKKCKTFRIALGGMQFDLLLADEGAKISVNTVYHREGEEAVGRLIRENVQGHGALPMRLRPYRTDSTSVEYPAFDSWGQVFAIERPQSGSAAESLVSVTDELTCWGSGRLNVERATDNAIERIAGLVLGDREVRRLLELRNAYFAKSKRKADSKTPQPADSSLSVREAKDADRRSLPILLDQLAPREGKRQQLEGLLTDRSTCHSLWIIIRAKERSWHSFCVADSANAATTTTWSFCW